MLERAEAVKSLLVASGLLPAPKQKQTAEHSFRQRYSIREEITEWWMINWGVHGVPVAMYIVRIAE